jgi:hypothetical protein
VGLNDYYLRRWSLLVRLRDDHVCFMCEERDKHNCDAHHIYPKADYPEKAYDLDNGVAICKDCHYPIVHTSDKSWRKWTCAFKRWVNRKAHKAFQRNHEHKIQKWRNQG